LFQNRGPARAVPYAAELPIVDLTSPLVAARSKPRPFQNRGQLQSQEKRARAVDPVEEPAGVAAQLIRGAGEA